MAILHHLVKSFRSLHNLRNHLLHTNPNPNCLYKHLLRHLHTDPNPDHPELLDGCYLDSITQIELYSFKTDSWKEISKPKEPNFDFVFYDPATHANGFYYWVAFRNMDGFLLCFDFASEKFSTLPLPDVVQPLLEGISFSLVEFNGLLGVLTYPIVGKSFDLWVMNGSWTREFTIESIPKVERPLGFWKNGGLFLEGSNNELLLFDFATRELKPLNIFDRKETMQVIPYVKSFVSLNGEAERV
ncbi:hypothetical protein PTKIN_Ptkin15bG0188300 [Pterospermum kingtungense]